MPPCYSTGAIFLGRVVEEETAASFMRMIGVSFSNGTLRTKWFSMSRAASGWFMGTCQRDHPPSITSYFDKTTRYTLE